MRKIFSLLLAAAFVAVPTGALAGDSSKLDDVVIPSNLTDNLYVKLYASRLKRARLQVDVAAANKTYKGFKRARTESLVQTNSVSLQEHQERSRDAVNASVGLKEAQAAEREAQAMLNIAIANATIGRDVPICLELR